MQGNSLLLNLNSELHTHTTQVKMQLRWSELVLSCGEVHGLNKEVHLKQGTFTIVWADLTSGEGYDLVTAGHLPHWLVEEADS